MHPRSDLPVLHLVLLLLHTYNSPDTLVLICIPLSWYSAPVTPVTLSCYSCSATPVLLLLFCYSCSATPVLLLLFCYSCYATPVLLLQFCYSCSATPVLLLQFCYSSSAILSCYSCFVILYFVMFYLLHVSYLSCPDICVLFFTCPSIPVLISFHYCPNLLTLLS